MLPSLFFNITMLTIKQKGLTVALDDTTGLCHLKYMYPICRRHYHLFTELATTLGACVVTGRKGQFFMQYITTGNSQACFAAYKAVQKKLMLMSRTYKLCQLSQEIQQLQS